MLNPVVAADRRDDLLMVDRLKCWKFSNGSPIADQLVRADRFWNVKFTEQADQKRSRGFRITVALQQDIEHEPMLVHGPPQTVMDTADGSTDFVHVPAGTGSKFPVTRHLGQERREFGVQLLERVVADLNATLRERARHIPVVEREAVVQLLGASCMMLIGKRWREGGGSVTDPVCRIIRRNCCIPSPVASGFGGQ